MGKFRSGNGTLFYLTSTLRERIETYTERRGLMVELATANTKLSSSDPGLTRNCFGFFFKNII